MITFFPVRTLKVCNLALKHIQEKLSCYDPESILAKLEQNKGKLGKITTKGHN